NMFGSRKMEQTEDAAGFQKAAFASLVVAHAFNDMAGGFFAPLAPLIARELSLSLTMLGIIMTIRSFFGSLPQALFGWLVDRYPSRWWLLSTPFWVGIFRSAIGFAVGFWSLTFIMSVGSLGGACFHPPAASRVREVTGGRRGLSMAFYVGAGRVGHAVGPIVALALVSWFGLKGLAIAAAFYAIPMVLLTWFSVKPPTPKKSRPPTLRAAATSENWKPILLLYFVSLFRNAVTVNLGAYMTLYLASRGMSLWWGGTAMTVLLFSGGLGGLLGGWISDRAGRRFVILLSSLLTFSLLLAFLQTTQWLQFGLIPLLGTVAYSTLGLSVAYAQELLPNRPALAASLTQGANLFFSGLSLTAMGVLGDLFGLQMALHILLILLLMETCVALFLPGSGHGRPGLIRTVT
ncbi:MFS transporter, partial [Nitrospinota bacterium]